MRVLVTIASTAETTEEIAERIGAVLRGRGHVVDCRRPCEVQEVGRYDVVVLGSSVDAGHWQREARELVEREHDELAARPVWLFSSDADVDPPKPAEDPAEAAELVAATGAYEHHEFAKGIGKTALSIRMVDRDWDEVDWWATTIADSISSG